MEFLPWIAQRGLLPQSSEPCTALATFPPDVQHQIVWPVVRDLARQEGPSHLTTVKQVQWVMECLATGLYAPNSEQTLAACVKVYEEWLKQMRWAPLPVVEHPELFLPTIVRHLSLAFLVSSDTQRTQRLSAEQQIPQCKRILSLFAAISTYTAAEETLSDTMRITIGVCDSLLHHPEGHCPLADAICEDLLRALYHGWFRLCALFEPDEALWAIFRQHSLRWRHRTRLVTWWNKGMTCLTQHLVVSLAQRPHQDHGFVAEDEGLDQAMRAVSSKQIWRIWRGLFRAVGDPNAHDGEVPLTPDAYEECMRGVGALIDVLNAGYQEIQVTDGHTLLLLFGPWLFRAAKDCTQDPPARPEFVEGQSVAVGAICRVFCRAPTKNVSREDLEQFYFVLCFALQHPHLRLSVLMNTQELFTCFHEGSFILILPFVSATRQVLCAEKSGPGLRAAAIQVIISLIAFPNQYPDVGLMTSPLAKASSETELRLLDLKYRLADICLDTVGLETDAVNLQMLMHALSLLVLDDEVHRVQSTPDGPLVCRVIAILLPGLEGLSWSLGVTITAFDTLQSFVVLHDLIRRSDPLLTPKLISCLVRYIIKQITQPGRKHSKHLHTMIVAGYHCLGSWVAVYPDIVTDEGLVKSVVQLALLGLVGSTVREDAGGEDDPAGRARESPITPFVASRSPWVLSKAGARPQRVGASGVSTSGPPSKRVQDAAHLLLRTLEDLGNPLRESAPTPVEDELERRLLEGEATEGGAIRLFVVEGHTLLTIIDNADEGELLVITRDEAARHVWRLKQRLRPAPSPGAAFSKAASGSTPVDNPPSPKVQVSNDAGQDGFDLASQNLDELCCLPEVFERNGGQEAPDDDSIHRCVSRLVSAQVAKETPADLGQAAPCVEPPVISPDEDSSGACLVRVLLSNLGLSNFLETTGGSVERLKEIIPHQPGPIAADIRALDCLPMRTRVSVGVLCINPAGNPCSVDDPKASPPPPFWAFYQHLRTNNPTAEAQQAVPALILNGSLEVNFVLASGDLRPFDNLIVYGQNRQHCAKYLVLHRVQKNVIVVARLQKDLFYTCLLPSPTQRQELEDGLSWAVVSKKILAYHVRLKIACIIHRAQINNDAFVHPHITRRTVLQKLISSHTRSQPCSEMLLMLHHPHFREKSTRERLTISPAATRHAAPQRTLVETSMV